jgi:hypothetical protein
MAMRLRLFLLASLVAGATFAGLATSVFAQSVSYNFTPTGTASYNVDANWLNPNNNAMLVPWASSNEVGLINAGGTAEVNEVLPASAYVGAIAIGTTATGSGTLDILSGGTLGIVPGPSPGTTGVLANGNISIGATGSGTVRVRAGGTLTATGVLSTGTNANDMLIVGQTAASTSPAATLSVGAAVLAGTTHIYPNAVFSTTGNASLINTGTYNSEINSSGSGKINAGNIGIVNGTLNLNFTGVTPTLGGASYTVLEAATIAGSFTRITSNAATPFNQVFVPSTVDIGGGRKQLRVGLQESIVLEVNRDNGEVKMTHPGSTGITLDSYYITSAAGALVPGSFSGFQDNGLFGGNWVENQPPSANTIAELKPTGNATYSAGTTTPLGNIYNPYSGAFGGASEEDLQFNFSRYPDGTVVPAVVKYTGTKVNNLLLQVDPTGAQDSYLRNTSNTVVQIDGYHVQSAAGRISPTNWTSLDDNNVGGANVWVEGLNNTANLISEFNQSIATPSLTLNPGDDFNLGKLFLGGAQDLNFQFLQVGQATAATGVVLYEAFDPSAGVVGDYNGNGVVDAGDYTIWRDTLGSTTDLRANGDNTGGSAGKIDAADYALWKSRFGATSGSGSIAGTNVPEPATWLMLASLLGLVASTRRAAR